MHLGPLGPLLHVEKFVVGGGWVGGGWVVVVVVSKPILVFSLSLDQAEQLISSTSGRQRFLS